MVSNTVFSDDLQKQISNIMLLKDDFRNTLVSNMEKGDSVAIGTIGEGLEDFYIVERKEDDWYSCTPYYEIEDNTFTKAYKELKSVQIDVRVTREVLHAALENPKFKRLTRTKPNKIRVEDVLNFAREEIHLREQLDITKENFSLTIDMY